MKLQFAAAAITAALCLPSYADSHDHAHHDHDHKAHQHDHHEHDHKAHQHDHHEHDHKAHQHDHHEHDHDDHHHHGAHVHGQGQLTLIQENDKLVMQLQIPTDSLWGFERPPESEAESQKIYEVLRKLEQGHSYFNFEKNKQCEASTSEVKTVTNGGHQEVEAQWLWHCDGTVNWLESTLFLHYKIHNLNLQWLNDNGSGGAVLTPTNPAAHW